eukprot:TRINITY_DN2312_c1_g1_i2.p1 TRINITY_DN2312_c1_g1~~TRINITY_DN2312_c1_g1_i2.p1  ORF type:complete len:275 (+),score=32.75 TRINITY_DN2312_c1_g1_i2:261-1085(+)
MVQPGVSASDLVSLNLGGEKIVTVKRSLLLQFEDSFLASMFSGRHEDRLDRDGNGNVFLDYSPNVMMPLVEYLRLRRDASPEETVPLPDIAEGSRKAWDSMLRVFLLSDVLTPAPFTFSGIRENVKISELTGWSMFFCKPYSRATTMSDFVPPDGTVGSALLVAARRSGSDTLALAAMGDAGIITQQTTTQKTELHNGVYWYCMQGKSVGFAPSEKVDLKSADRYDKSDSNRLSWHLDDFKKLGGYRAGATTSLNCAEDWEKVIFISSARLRVP